MIVWATSVFSNATGTYVADERGIFRLKPGSSSIAQPAISARPPVIAKPVAAKPVAAKPVSSGKLILCHL